MKRHWYCLTFILAQGKDDIGSSHSYVETYRGYDEMLINIARIQEAKKLALQNSEFSNGTMISCSYLGYMTIDEFSSGEDVTVF